MASTLTLTEDEAIHSNTEIERVIVVGLNRPRLLKIISMVADSNETSAGGRRRRRRNVEYISCVATMSSYEGTDGEDIRYMSSFILADGSPMNKLFDDEEFRLSLTTVIMVGYEWKDSSDEELVKNYFNSNMLLSITVKCVQPNEGFSTLNSEMNYFKNLPDEEKSKILKHGTYTDDDQTLMIGPMKMVHFILDNTVTASLDSIDDSVDEVVPQLVETEIQQETKKQQKKIPGFIDQKSTSYACRMCRTVLIGQNHLVEHRQNQHSFNHYRTKQIQINGAPCQSLFCNEDVLEWLVSSSNSPQEEEDQADNEGKLSCSKCSVKVGHWNWSGAQCSCGTWVVPAIQINLSKVDVILPESERAKVYTPTIVMPVLDVPAATAAAAAVTN
jgi:dual specificity phosphatase 12